VPASELYLPLSLAARGEPRGALAVLSRGDADERLDYFGSTVNTAARIVGLSGGHDGVVSGTVRDDPEVAAKLADGDSETEPIEAVLKGFEDAPFELWRVRAG
jgi:adenylate cyclase